MQTGIYWWSQGSGLSWWLGTETRFAAVVPVGEVGGAQGRAIGSQGVAWGQGGEEARCVLGCRGSSRGRACGNQGVAGGRGGEEARFLSELRGSSCTPGPGPQGDLVRWWAGVLWWAGGSVCAVGGRLGL